MLIPLAIDCNTLSIDAVDRTMCVRSRQVFYETMLKDRHTFSENVDKLSRTNPPPACV